MNTLVWVFIFYLGPMIHFNNVMSSFNYMGPSMTRADCERSRIHLAKVLGPEEESKMTPCFEIPQRELFRLKDEQP